MRKRLRDRHYELFRYCRNHISNFWSNLVIICTWCTLKCRITEHEHVRFFFLRENQPVHSWYWPCALIDFSVFRNVNLFAFLHLFANVKFQCHSDQTPTNTSGELLIDLSQFQGSIVDTSFLKEGACNVSCFSVIVIMISAMFIL